MTFSREVGPRQRNLTEFCLRHSQTLVYTHTRSAMDRSASALLEPCVKTHNVGLEHTWEESFFFFFLFVSDLKNIDCDVACMRKPCSLTALSQHKRIITTVMRKEFKWTGCKVIRICFLGQSKCYIKLVCQSKSFLKHHMQRHSFISFTLPYS